LLLRWGSIALRGWGIIILSCAPAIARTAHEGHGGNCVAYAREVTGIHLDGNAASWWPHAEGRYQRGSRPSIGAILVFKPYARMRVGHVAVVSRIVGSREILVDQANWVRGRITQAMSVIDASPQNDWTNVKVLEPHSGTHGRENPTYGFIYPRALSADFGERIVELQPRPHHATQVADRANHRADEHARHETEQADPTKAKHRLAATAPSHHKHKVDDAKLAYVY
jgi:surface antigen